MEKKCESLKNDLRRFVRKYIFGQMSSGQKDGGLSAAVMCSAVMCPAAKWVDTLCHTSSHFDTGIFFEKSDESEPACEKFKINTVRSPKSYKF